MPVPPNNLEPRIRWASAAPLWQKFVADKPSELERPAILRFENDEFMEEFKAILEQDPSSLNTKIADPRRYLEPGDLQGAIPKTLSELKLYQPTHGHFYLLAASLTCRQLGLPDRAVNPSTEKVGFVLRRFAPDLSGQEMAWVTGSDGKKAWKKLEDSKEANLESGEELFPMFPLTYCDQGQRRRVWAGLIPTSSRETFKASGLIPASAGMLPSESDLKNDRSKLLIPDIRLEELDGRVLKRLKEIEDSSFSINNEVHTFLLLDLADWLESTIPDAWNALNTNRVEGDFAALYNTLEKQKVTAGISWRAALIEVKTKAASLYGEATGNVVAPSFNLKNTDNFSDILKAQIKSLLEKPSVTKTGSPSSSARVPVPPFSKFDPLGAQEIPRYVLRCVYLRPQCYPWSHELLSAPSQAFTIAAFFDADAPVRPVRITLPDTSLANLRKFKKGVSFSISKKLREQMNSVSDAKKALKGELSDSPSFDLGMICSLSIPIITICAFVVLMIFLILLNLVFWWLPFFRICFPIVRPK